MQEQVMDDGMGETPIACMLDSDGFEDRMAWIAELNTRALTAARRDDLRLELEYAPSAIADVRQMIAQEQECCAFLSFDLQADANAVTLAITAPETARDAAELVFGPFQQKSPQPAACGCTGRCGA